MLIQKTKLSLALALLMTSSFNAQASTLSAAQIEQRNAETATARLAAQTIMSLSSDSDGDGLMESPAFQSNAIAPVGGGIPPAVSGAPQLDPYGKTIGYCVQSVSINTTSVFAIVTPGLDNTFQTTCAQALAGNKNGDDFLITYNSSQIQGSATRKFFGDPVIDKNSLDALPTTDLYDGQIRLITSTNQLWRWNGVQWNLVGSPWAFNGNDLYFNEGNVAIGKVAATAALDVVGSGLFTGTVQGATVNATGANGYQIAGTTVIDGSRNILNINNLNMTTGNVSGNLTVMGDTSTANLTASGNATVGGTLGVTGVLTASGGIATTTINASGALNANSAVITNGLTANSLSATSASVSGALTAGSISTGAIAASSVSTTGNIGVGGSLSVAGGISTAGLTSTGAIVAPVGAAGTPTFTFVGNTNTGIYSSASNNVDIGVGGARILNVSATGVDVKSGGISIAGTSIVDSSRNLTNIGTISSKGVSSEFRVFHDLPVANYNTITGSGDVGVFTQEHGSMTIGSHNGSAIRISDDSIRLNASNRTDIGLVVNSNNYVGIATTNPQNTLSLGDVGSIGQDINSMYVGVNFTGTGSGGNYRKTGNYGIRSHYDSALGTYSYQTALPGTAGSPIAWQTQLKISAGGNTILGSDSDNGVDRLQVSGNGSFTGNLYVSTSNATGGGIVLADDGDIVDLQDGYASMRFSQGVNIYSANRGGSPVIRLGSNGVQNIYANGYTDYGPNTTWAATLRVGGNGHTDGTKASVVTTNGDLHLSAMSGTNTYLNYYAGDMVYFGNGAGTAVASVDSSGNASFRKGNFLSGQAKVLSVNGAGDTYNNGSILNLTSDSNSPINYITINSDVNNNEGGETNLFNLTAGKTSNTVLSSLNMLQLKKGNALVEINDNVVQSSSSGIGLFNTWANDPSIQLTGSALTGNGSKPHIDFSRVPNVDYESRIIMADGGTGLDMVFGGNSNIISFQSSGSITASGSINSKNRQVHNFFGISGPESGNRVQTNSWYKLGTFSNSLSSFGASARINLRTGNGYNNLRFQRFYGSIDLRWGYPGGVEVSAAFSEGNIPVGYTANSDASLVDVYLNLDAIGWANDQSYEVEILNNFSALTWQNLTASNISGTPSNILASNFVVTSTTNNTVIGKNTDNGVDKLQVEGSINSTGVVQGARLVSTVATGTAPLTVASTTLVSNLNADLLDGMHATSANTASTIVSRDASGNFIANTIYQGNPRGADGGQGYITSSGDVRGYPYATKFVTFQSPLEFYGITQDYSGYSGEVSIVSNYIFGNITFSTGSKRNIAAIGDANLAMRIHSTGNVSIGTGGDGGSKLYVVGAGLATGGFSTGSDIRIKKDVEYIEGILAKIESVPVIRYHLNNQQAFEKKTIGTIAQELEKVFPEAVTNHGHNEQYDIDNFLSVNYGQLSAIAIQGVKELDQKVGSLSKLNAANEVEFDKPVLIKQNLTAERLSANDAYIKRLEITEKLKAKEIEAERILAEKLNSGERLLNADDLLFQVMPGAIYTVQLAANDGEMMMAQVVGAETGVSVKVFQEQSVLDKDGKPIIKPQTMNIVPMGNSIGVSTGGKLVKATWLRAA